MNIERILSFARDARQRKEQVCKWHKALDNMTKAYVKANGDSDGKGITIGELCTFEVRSLGSSGNGLKMLGEMLAHFNWIQHNNMVWDLNGAIDKDPDLKKAQDAMVKAVMEEAEYED